MHHQRRAGERRGDKNLLAMLKWISVVAILFAAPVYAEFREEHHRAGDWEFGYYEGEGGTPTPSGSTKELSGKGAPLILERCLAGGSVLTFAIHMEGEILGSQNYRLGWIFVQGEENGTPTIMDGGLDGWYFTWVLADRHPVVRGATLSICPSDDAMPPKCRTFSSKGMMEAAAFLCRRRQ
jgi:hypothetical protein